MNPVKFTFVLQDEVTPKTLELYESLCDEEGNIIRTEFEREVGERLEASFDRQEELVTLQAQIDAYQEYIYELQSRLNVLGPMHENVKQILRDVQALKRQEDSPPDPDAPKQHARPSMAIRTLKRLHDDTEE